MFLQNKETGVLVEILDTKALIDPLKSKITGQVQAGEEEQDPEGISKQNLIFPSGESLPRCWIDADYQTNGK
jgi:hypothetical protein